MRSYCHTEGFAPVAMWASSISCDVVASRVKNDDHQYYFFFRSIIDYLDRLLTPGRTTRKMPGYMICLVYGLRVETKI